MKYNSAISNEKPRPITFWPLNFYKKKLLRPENPIW